MRKIYTIFFISTLFLTQQSFADVVTTNGKDDSDSKACLTIVNACLSAGFARDGEPGKAFWQDCMKPVLLGQTVNGVNVDAKVVTDCRKDKIKKLQKELQQLRSVRKS